MKREKELAEFAAKWWSNQLNIDEDKAENFRKFLKEEIKKALKERNIFSICCTKERTDACLNRAANEAGIEPELNSINNSMIISTNSNIGILVLKDGKFERIFE